MWTAWEAEKGKSRRDAQIEIMELIDGLGLITENVPPKGYCECVEICLPDGSTNPIYGYEGERPNTVEENDELVRGLKPCAFWSGEYVEKEFEKK